MFCRVTLISSHSLKSHLFLLLKILENQMWQGRKRPTSEFSTVLEFSTVPKGQSQHNEGFVSEILFSSYPYCSMYTT